ncbi:MAG: PEP-utilizing enzyme [Actinomycetota bacterium]|nr:PEP-utilizing enzyme [Actinomycetota bacterium]
MEVIKGIIACRGCVIGKTLVTETVHKREKTLLQTLSKEFYDLDIENVEKIEVLKKDLDQKKLKHGDIQAEIDRFRLAIKSSRQTLVEAKGKLKKNISEKFSEIIDFQILALKDTNIFDKVIQIIGDYRISAYLALSIVFNERIELLKRNKKEKFKNRIYDLIDLYNRLVGYLKPTAQENTSLAGKKGQAPLILITNNLFPTDLAEINFDRIKGIVSQKGSLESHTSILVKSIKIPYLIQAESQVNHIKNNQTAILDGYLGILILDPDPATLQKYQDYCFPASHLEIASQKIKSRLPVMANINSAREALEAKKMGAEGIGLFRTELSILNGDMGLTLEKQYQNYKTILSAYGKQPVTLRMLDLSGDKQALINLLYKQSFNREEIKPKINEILKIQLEAMLMASVCGNLSISLPMVSKPEDIINFKQILAEAQQKLIQKGIKFKSDIPLIAIIEAPASIFSLDYILANTHSISIGTNDLFSLSFAASRFNQTGTNEQNFLYQPTLKMLRFIIEEAKKYKKQVTVCGEAASHPYYIPLLIGMGISGLSVGLRNYFKVKDMLKLLDIKKCAQLARETAALETKPQIEKLIKSYLPESGFNQT